MRALIQWVTDRLPLRTIDRYLMKQFMIAWGICAFAVFGLFSVVDGVSRLDRFLRQDDPLPLVALKYFAGMIPIYFTQYLGPILTLLAAMFAVTQLNKGSELLPLRAAGLPISRILASFFMIALVMALSMILVQELVVPSFKDEIRLADSYGRALASIQPDMVADSRNNLIRVTNYLPHEKRGQDVEITTKHSGLSTTSKITRAREILWKNPQGGEPYWLLRDGEVEQFDERGMKIPIPGPDGSIRLAQEFSEMKLTTDMRPVDLESSDREIEYLSFRELRDQYKRRPHLKHLEVKLHRRFAFPLANFILLMLGLPFILRSENQSVVLGISIALALGATYLIVTETCANLGTRGALNPMLAAWLPVLFFGALGLTLFDGVED
jgi:lipopolysaccharide export system permease protein